MLAASRIRVPLLALTLAALPGCYDAHDLEPGPQPLEDGSVRELGPQDGGPPPDAELDASVTVDAGRPVCQQDFIVRTLSVPTLASGVGFDLDGGGTQVGCGIDGPDGVDNALGSLAALAGTVSVDLNQLLTAAITLRLVRLRVRLDRCDGVPTLVMVDPNGAPLGTPRAAVVETAADGSFTFAGSVDQVPISLMIPFGPGIRVDVSLDEVQLAGTVVGTNLSSLVIGGELPQERILALASSFGGIAGLPPEVVEGLLAGLLDLHMDMSTGGCTAMSGAFLATGTLLEP